MLRTNPTGERDSALFHHIAPLPFVRFVTNNAVEQNECEDDKDQADRIHNTLGRGISANRECQFGREFHGAIQQRCWQLFRGFGAHLFELF